MTGRNRSPQVSVCVQTYQHGPFIEQCLDGILGQETDFDYEILLGEDDSSDGTREICIEYAQRFPDRIRLFLHDRKDNISIDGRPSGRFNCLYNLSHVKGGYFSICEGDDYWTDSRKLQKQYDFLEANGDYALCFHAVHILKGLSSIDSYIKREETGTTTINELAKRNYIYTCSCMYRNCLPGTFPDFFYSVPFLDYVLHLYTAQYGKIMYFPEKMAVYRIHEGGLWSAMTSSKQHQGQLSVLDALLIYLSNNIGVSRQLEKHRLQTLIKLLRLYRDEGNGEKSRELLERIDKVNAEVFLELLHDAKTENGILTQKLGRLHNHPVTGRIIRLLARIKRDRDFGNV